MNRPEFKEGDIVHLHAYGWYKPQPRLVNKVIFDEDRIFYMLGSTTKTTGLCIVESTLFVPPSKEELIK